MATWAGPSRTLLYLWYGEYAEGGGPRDSHATRYSVCPERRRQHRISVLGEDPRDIVFVPGWISNIEVFWEDPALARFFTRLASFSRLILFDKRGTGLSDRVADMPGLEVRMDDVRAVMGAVGSDQATLFGTSEGGPMCALFTAAFSGPYLGADHAWQLSAPHGEERGLSVGADKRREPSLDGPDSTRVGRPGRPR